MRASSTSLTGKSSLCGIHEIKYSIPRSNHPDFIRLRAACEAGIASDAETVRASIARLPRTDWQRTQR